MRIFRHFTKNRNVILYNGDCLQLIKELPSNIIDLTITSPPYCMGKDYDKSRNIDDFIKQHKIILPEIIRLTKTGGNICWQVGYHVKNGIINPLDYYIHNIMSQYENIVRLQNLSDIFV